MAKSLIPQAYQIKQKLLDYGLQQFAAAYQALETQVFPGGAGPDEALALQDWFVLEHILPDHRTVLSHFLEALEDGGEAVIAEQWGMVIQGVFHVRQVLDHNHFELMNLVNDVLYVVAGNPVQDLGLEKGEYLMARLLPHQDYHIFTGLIDRLPTRKKNEIYALVAEVQTQNPKMAFIDNIDRIALAYRIQEEEQQDFISFFGRDEIVLPGSELEDKLKEFYHYRYFQKKQLDGDTIAKTFQSKYHQPPLPPQFDFLDNIQAEPDVGVIYDKTEGLVFLLRYGRFQEIFARSDFKSIPDYRQILTGYLEDPNISTLPFKRMIDQHPDNAANVFKAFLKRKRFQLDKDFAALMKRYKPMAHLTRLTPGTIPAAVRSKTFLRSLKAQSKW